MFAFREYFPVFAILIFSILTYFSSAYLLRSVDLSFIPSAIILLFIFALTLPYTTKLLLEPPTFSLVAISLALHIKGRIFLSAVFLLFASLIRPEFSIVGLLYILKTQKLRLSFLLIPLVLTFILQNVCGDQTNFHSWTYRAYLVNVENYTFEKAREKIRSDYKNCLLSKFGINIGQNIERYMLNTYPFSKYRSECLKEMAKSNVKWKTDELAKHFIENIFFFSVVPKVKFFNLLSPISIVFGILTILGLIFYYKKDWFIPISYISIVMLYTIYFPYGLFEFARFKLYILPFEILLIAQLLRYKIQDFKTNLHQ